MAIKLMAHIWESGPESQGERFVLLALADYANDAGECWPAIEGIAKKCCIEPRSVRRIIRRLEENGWLETDQNRGRMNTNFYRIKPDPMSPGHKVPRTESAENRTLSTEKPDTGSPEPSRTVKNRHSCAKVERFDEFWQVYPHRGGVKRNRKGSLQKYTAAVKRGVGEESLIEAAKVYAKDRRVIEGYARDPVTWLNQEGWTDEPAPSQQNGGYDPQQDKWDYIAKHGSSAGWRSANA